MAAAVAAGLLAALLPTMAAPAQAAQPQLRLEPIGNVQLQVGGGVANVTVTVVNDGNQPAQNVQLLMTVPGELAEIGVFIASTPNGCNRSNNNTRMDCTIGQIDPVGGRFSGTAQIGVPGNSPVQAGDSRNGTIGVALQGGFNGSTSFNVRVQGPDRPETVPEVSGVVRDEQTGQPIEGVRVLLADGQQSIFETTTNANGEFSFRNEQIVPGTLFIDPSKDGYLDGEPFEFPAQAGDALTGLAVTLRSEASPTPTPSPTATATASATATAPAVAPAASSDSGGPSFFTIVMLILGGLLVLAGAGAMAWMWYRRRKERREDEGPEGADSPTSGPRGPLPTPGSRGVYHPTPTQAMGAAPTQVLGGGQTQVLGAGGRPLPAVGPRPGLADATTMMHQRGGGPDETAHLPRAGSPGVPYAGDPSQTRPVGPRPPLPGTPPPPRPPAPTYGTPSPYEDTRGYGRPQPTQPYGSPSGRHASPAPSAPDGGGYDRGTHDRGSYDGGSYGPDPYTQPAAGHRPQPSHRDQRGYGEHYDQGYRDTRYETPEYDGGHQRPAYDQPTYRRPSPSPEPRGYNDHQYDEPTTARPRHADPAERRRLDWLDDS